MEVNNNTEYSERKIKAKKAPEYSVLNPDTNSDSASEKSKGARWVSAKEQINQIKIKEIKRGDESSINLFTEKDETLTATNTTNVLKTDS